MSEQIKRAIEIAEKVVNSDYLTEYDVIKENWLKSDDECDVSEIFNWYENLVLQALQSELDRQENKALTLSELKEMVGEPVYYVRNWEDEEDNYHEEGWTVLMQVKEGRVEFCDIDGDISSLHVGIDDIVFYKHKPTEGVGR